MSSQVSESIYQALAAIRLIDPHSHINPHDPASHTLADLLGYHYYTELAHSAGMPKSYIEDKSISRKELVSRLVQGLPAIENTAQYRWLIELCRTFYGFDSDRIDASNWEELYDISENRMQAADWPDMVLAQSNVEAVFLTNDFDDNLTGFDTDVYIPCLRTDELVFHFAKDTVRQRLSQCTGVNLDGSLSSLREALKRRFEFFVERGARACAISLPPSFEPTRVADGRASTALDHVLRFSNESDPAHREALSRRIFWTLAELCDQYGLPFDLMIGVNRGVYADGVYQGCDLYDSRVSLIQYRELFNAFPQVKFPISVLASVTNQELVSYAWIFPNVITNGHWWYSNTPSFIARDAAVRLEAVPQTKQIAYYSDAYKLEFVWPKFDMYRRTLADLLAENFVRKNGWSEERAIEFGRRILRDNVDEIFPRPDKSKLGGDDFPVLTSEEDFESSPGMMASLGGAVAAGALATSVEAGVVSDEPHESDALGLDLSTMNLEPVENETPGLAMSSDNDAIDADHEDTYADGFATLIETDASELELSDPESSDPESNDLENLSYETYEPLEEPEALTLVDRPTVIEAASIESPADDSLVDDLPLALDDEELDLPEFETIVQEPGDELDPVSDPLDDLEATFDPDSTLEPLSVTEDSEGDEETNASEMDSADEVFPNAFETLMETTEVPEDVDASPQALDDFDPAIDLDVVPSDEEVGSLPLEDVELVDDTHDAAAIDANQIEREADPEPLDFGLGDWLSKDTAGVDETVEVEPTPEIRQLRGEGTFTADEDSLRMSADPTTGELVFPVDGNDDPEDSEPWLLTDDEDDESPLSFDEDLTLELDDTVDLDKTVDIEETTPLFGDDSAEAEWFSELKEPGDDDEAKASGEKPRD